MENPWDEHLVLHVAGVHPLEGDEAVHKDFPDHERQLGSLVKFGSEIQAYHPGGPPPGATGDATGVALGAAVGGAIGVAFGAATGGASIFLKV